MQVGLYMSLHDDLFHPPTHPSLVNLSRIHLASKQGKATQPPLYAPDPQHTHQVVHRIAVRISFRGHAPSPPTGIPIKTRLLDVKQIPIAEITCLHRHLTLTVPVPSLQGRPVRALGDA